MNIIPYVDTIITCTRIIELPSARRMHPAFISRIPPLPLLKLMVMLMLIVFKLTRADGALMRTANIFDTSSSKHIFSYLIEYAMQYRTCLD